MKELTEAERLILKSVYGTYPQSCVLSAELREEKEMDPSTVSSVVQKFERNNWLQKIGEAPATDGKDYLVKLTPRGREEINEKLDTSKLKAN